MMQTTTRNATLDDLAAMLMDQQTRKHDIVVPAAAVHSDNADLVVTGSEPVLTDDGVTITDGRYRPTAIADEGVAEKLGIPTGYLKRLRADRPDLYDANVNGWLHGDADGVGPDDRSFLLRTFKPDSVTEPGIARALLSDRYARIDHLDALTAALDGVRQAGTDVVIDSADLTDRRMTVRLVAPGLTVLAENLLAGYRNPFGSEFDRWRDVAAREGMGYGEGEEPIVFAGLVISNSETGGGAFTVVPRMVVKVCKNGLTITKDALRAVHLGGKMDDGVIRWSEATQAKQLDLITSKTTDAVRTFLDVDYMTSTIRRLEVEAGKPVETVDAVKDITKGLAFSKEQTDGVLGMFLRGGQMSVGGVANAVTAYAQVVASGDEAHDLELAAARLLNA